MMVRKIYGVPGWRGLIRNGKPMGRRSAVGGRRVRRPEWRSPSLYWSWPSWPQPSGVFPAPRSDSLRHRTLPRRGKLRLWLRDRLRSLSFWGPARHLTIARCCAQ